MSTDFVDEDLVVASGQEALPSTGEGARAESSSRMVRQREKLTDDVASAAQEIERLRLRQEELEREKVRLAELNICQERYTSGKRELIGDLNQALLVMKKDQMRAERLVELLGITRSRFQDMLDEMHDLDEDRWDEKDFDEQLATALALVEKSRLEYGRSMARVDAESLAPATGRSARHAGERGASRPLADRGVWFWFKVGLAATLPLILALTALVALYLYFMGGW